MVIIPSFASYVKRRFWRDPFQGWGKSVVEGAHRFIVIRLHLHSLALSPFGDRAGVQTKNAKAATTYLLEIPDLLKVVEAWDVRVRAKLSPDVLWYAKLSRDGLELAERMVGHVGRRELVARGLARLCSRANIAYHSPHKLRHGHAVYAIGNATTIADFKAVSQNLMHGSLSITDRVYGVLQGDDIRARIRALGGSTTAQPVASASGDKAAILAQIHVLLPQLEEG